MIVTSNGGTEFKPIPEGTYVAVCVRIIDLGTQLTTFKGADKLQRKVLIAWEIPEVEVEFDGETRPGLTMSRYTASLSDKANLRKVLEAWRGKRFTEDELRGFDLKNILGQPCQVQILHSEHDGRTYANIASIMALPKGMTKPVPVHPLINFSLDADEFNPAMYDLLSDSLKQTIAGSPEYKARTGQALPTADQDPREFAPSDAGAAFDDDIPF